MGAVSRWRGARPCAGDSALEPPQQALKSTCLGGPAMPFNGDDSPATRRITGTQGPAVITTVTGKLSSSPSLTCKVTT